MKHLIPRLFVTISWRIVLLDITFYRIVKSIKIRQMEKLVLMSIRLPQSVIDGFDRAISGHYYWNRSDAMRNVLQNILKYADSDTLFRLMAGEQKGFALMMVSVVDAMDENQQTNKTEKEDSK